MRETVGVAVLLAVLGFWLLGAYNRLVRLRAAVGSAWGGWADLLLQRHSLARALALTVLPAQAGSAPWREVLDDLPMPAPVEPSPELRSAAALLYGRAHAAREALEAGAARAGRSPAVRAVQEAERALSQALADALGLWFTAALEAPLAPAQVVLVERLRQQRVALDAAGRALEQAVHDYNDARAIFPTTVAARLLAFRPAEPIDLAVLESRPGHDDRAV